MTTRKLAVAERALGVSQTTAARRIAALEAALELTLFERRQSGYVLTPAGAALLDSIAGGGASFAKFSGGLPAWPEAEPEEPAAEEEGDEYDL